MKLSLDTMGRAFRASLRPQANLVSFIYFIVAIVFYILMSLLGGLLSGLVRSVVPGLIFSVIGLLGMLYVLFASAYILNYMAIADLRDNKRPGFFEAFALFNKEQGHVLVLPALIGGIILFEMLILYLIGLIDVRNLDVLVLSIFSIPFLVVNIVLFTILVLGAGIFLPVMVDQKKGAFATIKAILLTIKQQFLRVLITQVAVTLLLGVVGLLVFAVFSLSNMIGQTAGVSLMPPLPMLLANPARFLNFSGLNAVGVIGMVFYLIGFILILGAILAYIWNLNMCLYSAFYLGFLKDNVNYNENLIAKVK